MNWNDIEEYDEAEPMDEWQIIDIEYRARMARENAERAEARHRYNQKLLILTCVFLVVAVGAICEALYYWG